MPSESMEQKGSTSPNRVKSKTRRQSFPGNQEVWFCRYLQSLQN
uniref:Uncharacterized protein n=1 Tax=Heterorhabditis bacteriophora TaxID=37862 RepID=A0A1I7WW26_HETBA